jgi:hypothetical protein
MIERDDGIRLHKTEVVVTNLIFLSKREESAENADSAEVPSDLETIDFDDRF